MSVNYFTVDKRWVFIVFVPGCLLDRKLRFPNGLYYGCESYIL